MKRISGRLTYANVMATVAVFLALGGAGYAAIKLPKNSVGTKQLKNGAVTGPKVKLSSLGTVPSATNAATAQNAVNAQHAASAATAGTATNAAHADSAGDASSLGGLTPDAYARAGSLAVISPTLEHGWHFTEVFGAPGFAKDQFGIVHLFGNVSHTGASAEPAFTLPPGYRPGYEVDVPASFSTGTVGVVHIGPSGNVMPFSSSASFIELEGISFRAVN